MPVWQDKEGTPTPTCRPIFISYSTQNRKAADRVCAALESVGLQCWIAPRDIAGGMAWTEAIMGAIEACRVMVLLISAATNSSEQVQNELTAAASKKRAIVPVLLEQTPLSRSFEYYLGRVQWIQADVSLQESHLSAVVSAVRVCLGQADSAQADTEPAHRLPEESAPAFAAARRDNLPRQLSSFIGREIERQELLELLASKPLVTLAGTGHWPNTCSRAARIFRSSPQVGSLWAFGAKRSGGHSRFRHPLLRHPLPSLPKPHACACLRSGLPQSRPTLVSRKPIAGPSPPSAPASTEFLLLLYWRRPAFAPCR